MNRLIRSAVVASLMTALCVGAAAAQNRDFRKCDAKSDTETRMRVCTQAINSGLFRGKRSAINYNNRGWAYYDRQDYDRAIIDLNEAVRLDPQLYFAYINRGSAYLFKKDYDRAIVDFEQALRIRPNSVDTYGGLIRTYSSKGDIDRAIEAANAGLRVAPKNVLFLVARAGLMIDKHDYDRALADLNDALRISPKSVDALNQRGATFHEKKDYDRAIVDFSEALRIDPKSWTAYHGRGRAHREGGNYQRALADFSEAERLEPKQAIPLFGRSLTLEKMGDLNAAYRDVVEALTLDPANSDGQRSRERLRAALAGTPAQTQTVAPAANAPSPVPLSPSIASPATAGPRVALVIGNGRYRHAQALPNPANDASDVAASLRKLGFDVIEGRDLDKRGLEDKVREFSRKLDNARLALFFYAGHGIQVGGRNFLMPVDAKLERQGDLSFETVDVAQVLAQMEAEPRVNLIFLDACRDNPLSRSFVRTFGARSANVGQGLASIQSAVGTLIAYATQPDAVALDGTGRNSPFTTALLKHMNTPGLEIAALMRRVRAEVIQATNGKQVPWDHSSLLGDVVLAQ